MQSLQEFIADFVAESQGCKATEVAVAAAQAMHTSVCAEGAESVVKTIDTMIKNGDLVEIEYILAEMDYRVKSFLLPKGTKINNLD